MSDGTDITNDIPAGDLQFYDNYIPSLEAGNYFITVKHTLQKDSVDINEEAFGSFQEFVVSAPQFTIDSSQIVNQYPPAGSTGLYGEVLPHIVLKDPMLAWERDMKQENTPWITLMVFEDSELADGGDPESKAMSATVDSFLSIAAPVLAPKPKKEDDVDGTSSCSYIKMTVATFQALVPRIDELPYLSHVRKVNTGGKAIMGLNEYGLFSITACNRFACAPDSDLAKPVKNIVHLVSLEGFKDYLAADADLSAYTDVALISLASWTFLSLPDQAQDFRALVTNLVTEETNTISAIDPSMLWLRIPAATAGTGDAFTEAGNRIADGYVPLAYHTRSGENSFAWYRGPFTPVLPKEIAKPSPFFTADAAMIYDKTFGVFDVSLAAAWEAGREAALSDSYFGQKLFDFRKKAHWLTDSLQYRLASHHFSQAQIDQLENTTTVQDNFLALLTPQLIKDIENIAPTAGPQGPALQSSTTDPIADVKAFLADPIVLAKLQELIADDIAPVAEWLGNLLLLYPFPFDHMVPDERMLPVESLRFFYVDKNWLNAAIDGAMSLGLDSSRQTFFSQVTKGMIYEAAMQALAVTRDKLEGKTTGSDPVPPEIISGFLLRSALVTGWPNLSIHAQDENDQTLKILRMDHLSSSVLVCLFDGVPDNIELSEPQENLGFGVDQDGFAVLRNILSTGTPGAQIGTVHMRDMTGQQPLCMRSARSRVLNISPADNNGLVKTLVNALKQNGSAPVNDMLGPATFAIQLIKSAEAIIFYSQSS